jgi:hypothetical protein
MSTAAGMGPSNIIDKNVSEQYWTHPLTSAACFSGNKGPIQYHRQHVLAATVGPSNIIDRASSTQCFNDINDMFQRQLWVYPVRLTELLKTMLGLFNDIDNIFGGISGFVQYHQHCHWWQV